MCPSDGSGEGGCVFGNWRSGHVGFEVGNHLQFVKQQGSLAHHSSLAVQVMDVPLGSNWKAGELRLRIPEFSLERKGKQRVYSKGGGGFNTCDDRGRWQGPGIEIAGIENKGAGGGFGDWVMRAGQDW